MAAASEYVFEPIRNSAEFTLYRARQRGEPTPVLVVAPTTEPSSRESLRRLEHEYSLAVELEPAWAAKPLALTRYKGRTILVLTDPGGEPLDRLLERDKKQPLDLAHLLLIAINLASALGHAHRRGLIHKDVKPENVLVDEAGQVWLAGFGIASLLPRERQAPAPPEIVAGTFAYMSPEQTGRMNRSLDTRSDLYSLGVTLYQMLTGVLPFTAADSLEWIHCHIARQPVRPVDLRAVPEPLSAITMRLLAKNAEERYQTAAGLEADLRRCLSEWLSHGRIDSFSLGADDFSDRLLIPEKLYGREREVDALTAAFARVVAGGRPELVLVSGYSGIGKSALVNELHKWLVPPRGLFASGKFDQYKRDIPYATVAQAFQSLVRPLLSKPEAELSKWRDDIHEALSPNGVLLVDLVPELKLIIGEPPPVVALPPQEAKTRSHLAFRRFISVFARAEHPLVLFLDDLQWLDAATLDFLEDLLAQQDLAHLLVVGAYRDNEVDSTHPLMRKLSAIREAGSTVQQIRLAPLSLDDLAHLIADALHCESRSAMSLSKLIHAKTAGNPFFAIQFMHALVEERLITFEYVNALWRWDMDAIRTKGFTDNVVDLMVSKLNRLPIATQTALQQLACIGSGAEIATISAVLGTSEHETQAELWEALHQELIVRSESSYRFVHDRVQEAAYSLIAEEVRASSHLRIGRLLIAHTPPEKLGEAVFEIVNQLNRGSHLINSTTELERVAELNLMAARRAKASTAYTSALRYLATGREVLTEATWDRNYELIFSIQCLTAECELLTADMGAAENRLTMLAQRTKTQHDNAVVTRLRITLYTTLDQSDLCVDVFLEYLGRGGTHWERHPKRDEVLQEYERVIALVGDRQIEDLLDLPLMTNPDVLDALDVFTEIVHPAFFYDENLSSLVVCRMVSLSLEHGNCAASCFGYVWFAMFAGPRFNNYKDGYRLGQLGFDLVEKHGLLCYQARTYLTFATLTPWTKHFASARNLIHRGCDAAQRKGDLTYSAYGWKILITNYLMAGDPLADVQSESEKAFAFAMKLRFGLMVTICGTQRGLIRTLRGLTPRFGCFDDEEFDELRTERLLAGNPVMSLAEFFYWTRKLQGRFFAGDHAAAIAASERAQRLVWTATSQVTSADLPFYGALARAASWDSASSEERQRHFATLSAYHQQLKVWCEHCPANFENRTALVGAEIARIEGRELDAERLYEKAIRSARENGFVHNEGLAHELAAQYYLGRGLETAGYAYLQNARSCYDHWGAHGKIRQLEERFPRLREERSRASTIGVQTDQLDAETIVKASQALSSEMILPSLIEKLVRIAVEHVGAERGLLILRSDGRLRIEAEATTGLGRVEVAVRQADVTPRDLPQSALYYAIRTQECVLLNDASTDNVYSEDEYVRQKRSKSVLCLPISKQKKLVGALYLENNLTTWAFTPDRVEVLQLLASQAAISLENARLYSDLQLQAGLLQRLPVSAWTLKPDGTPDFVNQVWLEFAGQTLDFVRSHPEAWMTAIHPEDREMAAQSFWKGVHSGRGFAFETRSLRAQDGTYRWHLNQAVVLRDEEGEVLRFVGTSTDIDDQKRAQDEVRANELRLREMTETIPEMLWSATSEGAIDYCNARFLEYTGFSAGDLMADGWQRTIHPDDASRVAPVWTSSVRTGAPYRVEVRTFHAADRTYRWCLVSALPLLDQQGRILKWHGTIQDVHDWKLADEKVRRSEALLAESQRLSLTGSFMWRLETREITWSKELYRIFEFDEAAIVTFERISTRIHPEDLPMFKEQVERTRQEAGDLEFELRLQMPDRSIKYLNIVAYNRDVGDEPEYIGAVQDVTQRRLSEDALTKARSDLAHVVRVTSFGVMTASIAHEVNQPLSGIITNASTCVRMLDANPPNLDGARETAKRTIRDGNRASDIIARLRTLYSKKEPLLEPMDLNEATREVIALLRSELQRSGVILQHEFADWLPIVQGDRVQLQQVIVNLVRNASDAMHDIEDRPRRLLIRTEHIDENVCVTVQDSGIGFDPAMVDRLFESFYTTKPEGMGIGLSVSRSIIEAHGGRLWVIANEGPGSTFAFSVPCGQTTA
jgi:PAS domain S-box-containing protein